MTDWPKSPSVGVGCIVIRDGRILLVKRRGTHGGGTWSTPGGHLDFGESPQECAGRETMEETGVGVSAIEFVAITNDVYEATDRHYLTVWMRGQPDAAEAHVADEGEIAEVRWFMPDSLPEPLFLSFANLVAGRSLPPEPSNLGFLHHPTAAGPAPSG